MGVVGSFSIAVVAAAAAVDLEAMVTTPALVLAAGMGLARGVALSPPVCDKGDAESPGPSPGDSIKSEDGGP